MRLRKLRWWRYRVPLQRGVTTARGVLEVREGALLCIETASGRLGWGEAAPLELFGQGMAQVWQALPRTGAVVRHLLGDRAVTTDEAGTIASSAWHETLRLLPPSLAFAVETAVLDTLAQERGHPLAALLTPFSHRRVTVNAVASDAATEDAVQEARVAVDAGFRTLKLKVGVAVDQEAEVERVKAVRSAIGCGARLRLDANGAWTPAEAIAVLRELAEQRIELVEQPVRTEDIDGFTHVHEAIPLPLAADESVDDPRRARALLARGAVTALVLKPTVLGGIGATLALAALAARANVASIVTSSFETGVGLAACLATAAALPELPFACGLATAGHLQSDLVRSRPLLESGELLVPRSPGLGVVIDRQSLERYAVATGCWDGDA
ncbi:MAG: o-succinylbenzoate synthase [Chloroflexi bacterium]|nr:o-succinylbenzoate synthase [Chloroflexota bacterium]